MRETGIVNETAIVIRRGGIVIGFVNVTVTDHVHETVVIGPASDHVTGHAREIAATDNATSVPLIVLQFLYLTIIIN